MPRPSTYPAGAIYAEADRQQLERDWGAILSGRATMPVDASGGNLAASAAGGIELTKRITPEGKLIERFDESNPQVKGGVDTVVRALSGVSLDELKDASIKGTLPEKVSMRLADPIGNIVEAVMAETAKMSGLPPETVAKISGLSALVLGALYNPPGAAAKGPKIGERLAVTETPKAAGKAMGGPSKGAAGALGVGAAAGLAAGQAPGEAEAATGPRPIDGKSVVARLRALFAASAGAESRINLGRIDASTSVKRMMRQINQTEAAGLEESRRLLPHSETIAGAKQYSLEDVLGVNVKKYDFREIQEAARGFNTRATRRVERLMRAAEKGDDQAAADLVGAYAIAGHLSVLQEEFGRIAARSLEARKIETSGQGFSTKGLAQLYKGMRQEAQGAAAGDALAVRQPVAGEVVEETGLAVRQAGEVIESDTDIARRLLAGEVVEDLGLSPVKGFDVAETARAIQNELGAKDATEAGHMIAKRLKLMTAEQRAKMIGESVSLISKIGHGFYSTWINFLLSGPQTHAANFISNAITAAYAPAERFMAAAFDGWVRDREVFFSETSAMAVGMITAGRDALSMAGRALRTGESSFGPDKVREAASRINGRLLLGGELSTTASAIEHMRMALPSRWLTASDEFWKIINFSGEVSALALREARARGMSGSDVGRFVTRVRQNPAAYPDIVEKAQIAALDRTFNGPTKGLVGAVADGLMGVRTKYPIVGAVLPFIPTPANLLQFALERTPILNLASSNLRAELRAGGAIAALARGKIATSGVIGASFMTYAMTSVPGSYFPQLKGLPEGQPIPYMTLITGAGPKNPELRRLLETQLKWEPYSIWVDGKYRSYRRLEPWGTVLGLIADTAEIYGTASEQDFESLAGAVVVALSKFTEEKTFLQGVAQVFATIDGARDENVGALGAMMRGLAGSVVPTFLSQVNRETWDAQMHEARSMLDAIKARLPGYSQEVPVRHNLFGVPQLYSHGWVPFAGEAHDSGPGFISAAVDLVSPIKMSDTRKQKETPETIAAREILALRMSISALPRQVHGGAVDELGLAPAMRPPGVPLTGAQRERWQVLSGHLVKDRGMTMAEAIVEMIDRQSYKTQAPLIKQALIGSIIATYRERGLIALRKSDPDLDAKISLREEAMGNLQRRATDVRSPLQGVTDSGSQVRIQQERVRELSRTLSR